MTRPSFRSDQCGATAAEFSLVLPLLLIAIFGTIDVGRYGWAINQDAKATQVGARWAVATDMVDSSLRSYSFAVSGGITQGSVVPQTSFPGVTCTDDGTTTTCVCHSGGTCSWGPTGDHAAFTRLVSRMKEIDPQITASNVIVDYAWSGLGFSGDPNGPNVAPLTTIRLKNMKFSPITLFLFSAAVPLPNASYTLTLEDGQGTDAY